VSGEAGGGYFYPDSEDETGDAEPVRVKSTGRCAAANWCLMSETCVRLPDCEAGCAQEPRSAAMTGRPALRAVPGGSS
jgi:hypothetical protein